MMPSCHSSSSSASMVRAGIPWHRQDDQGNSTENRTGSKSRNPLARYDLGAMTATIDRLDVGALPLAPKNPLPIRQVLSAARVLHTGLVKLSEAGGPVTRFVPLPKFLAPALVLVTSPSGVRDVLGRTDGLTERCQIHQEVRNVAGDNLFVLPNKEWAPRRRALQPVFTKHNVDSFGRHMTAAAQSFADRWREVGDVDLE